MVVRVQKWGNSLAVRIPKPVAEEAAIAEGTRVNLSLERGRLVATPVREPRESLKELLRKVTVKNRHRETDFGAPRGREAW